MDDLNHVKNILKQGDWMTVNDLDSGYWHVPVHKDSWQYLGVHFIEDDGSVTFWTWRVLVLGIIDATHIFTRLLAPLIAKLSAKVQKPYARLLQQLTTLSPGETLLLEAPSPRLQRSGPVQADTGPQRVPLLLPTTVAADGCTTALQTLAGIHGRYLEHLIQSNLI